MQTLYRSTRDPKGRTITASQAVLQGLSPDGGLYVPTSIPELDLDLNELGDLSYQELAYRILQPLFSDYTEEELRACIANAYGTQWDTEEIAPVSWHADNAYLELFHGPTIAFKDVALQLLPHLMTTAAKKNGSDKDIVILTATSGDTGKAAMAGFADVDHTQIIVFYPKDGVSAIQERQMLTQTGRNTHVVGITGNFDVAQTNVKKLFNDKELAGTIAQAGYQFSSANSINIGRLFPQVEAYPDLKAHAAIADAIQQNSYLQKEITAARQLYNDSVMQWNADVFDWPTKQIVAARAGYTTRIPFSASSEVKAQARGTFF